jgi:hypothetical protein
MVPLNLLTCWSLLCGPWSSFVVSFSLGPYSRFPLALICGPALASVLWFPMARPNGPSSGSQWPILWFPMAYSLFPDGSSSVSNGPSSGSQWSILCGPSPGYLSRAPCGPCFGSRPAVLPQDCLLSYLQLLLPNLPSYFYFHFYLYLPF